MDRLYRMSIVYIRCMGESNPYDEDYEKTVDDETDRLLNEVYETFGCFSAWGLRNMTRREDPWKNSSPNQIIT